MSIIRMSDENQRISISKDAILLMFILAGFIVITIFLAGCGDEDNPVNNDTTESTWAGLPEITSTNFTPPDTTESTVASVTDLSHFEPYISDGKLFCEIYNYQNPFNCPLVFWPDSSVIMAELRIPPNYYLLVESGQALEPNLNLEMKEQTYSFEVMDREYTKIPYQYVGEFGGHYYYLSQSTMRGGDVLYSELANARWYGGDILNIGSTEENDFVYGIMTQEIPNEYLWLGLTDIYEDGTWSWLDGNNHSYSDWISGEPIGGDIAIKDYNNNGGWADVPAGEQWRLYHTMIESDDSICCMPDSTWRYVNRHGIQIYPSQYLVLDKAPLIRHVRYYKLMADGGLDVGGSYSNAYTLRFGVDTTIAASATRTIKGTVGLTWDVISASLSAELSETFSTSITIRRFTEESKTLTCEEPASGTQRKFIFWQKCERFELVDSLGNLWSDPNYEINPVLLDHPLNSYIIQTKDF